MTMCRALRIAIGILSGVLLWQGLEILNKYEIELALVPQIKENHRHTSLFPGANG
jgi:hypothetical protein